MMMSLAVPHEYDMNMSVQAWVYPDISPAPECFTRGELRRVVTVGTDTVPVTVLQDSPGRPLIVRTGPTTVRMTDLKEKMRWVLGLDHDTRPCINRLIHDGTVGRLAPLLSRIRPYSSDTVYEGLMKSVIQQQVSYRAACILTSRFVTLLGSQTKHDGRTVFAFPTPQMVSAAGVDKLRSIGLGYKAQYLHGISSMVCRGDLEPESLRNMTYGEVREVLLPIRGVGEWTVQTLAIASLKMFDVFPYSDLGIRNLLGRLYKGGTRMSAVEVERWADSMGEHGPMALYLLMCADVLGLVAGASRKRIKELSTDLAS
ncbi:MAG: hypothetical protein QXS20_02970 [Candidatus Thorarchaeota archaeon]